MPKRQRGQEAGLPSGLYSFPGVRVMDNSVLWEFDLSGGSCFVLVFRLVWKLISKIKQLPYRQSTPDHVGQSELCVPPSPRYEVSPHGCAMVTERSPVFQVVKIFF